MSEKHDVPDDPSRDPEQALDAMERKVFGTTMNQERDTETSDPDHTDPSDGTRNPPTTTESPA